MFLRIPDTFLLQFSDKLLNIITGFFAGLLYAGDKLVEVNGIPVEGLEPEQVIHILVITISLLLFKYHLMITCNQCKSAFLENKDILQRNDLKAEGKKL